MKLVPLLFLLAAIGGCQPEEPEPVGPVPENFAREQELCEKRGGRWGRGGAAGFFICYETMRDAGKACRKGTDCDGDCLARSQTCAPVRPLFGCNDILTDDGTRATLCRD